MVYTTNTTNTPTVTHTRKGPPPYDHLNIVLNPSIGVIDVSLRGTGNARQPDGYLIAPDMVVYVLFKMNEERTRPTRILGMERAVPGWRLGTVIHVRNAQTKEHLGEYMIVGAIDHNTGEHVGDVPDRKIALAFAV